MTPSATEIENPVVDSHRANLLAFFTVAYSIFFQWASHLFTVAPITIIGGLVTPFHYLWANYYWRVVFGGEGVAMPHSALSFIINALLALAEIKSQGLPEFPFQTHPRAIMFSVTSLLMYGLASTFELAVSAAGLDPTSIYAIVAHLGKIGSLCILVASLASLFYM